MADHIVDSVPTSRLGQLRQNEQHWIWKAGMRVFLCIIDIVAIGCAAWLTTLAMSQNSDGDGYDYFGYGEFPGTSIGSLIVLPIAFLWCLLALTIPFILKPSRPIHPGTAVGIDLILWLAFIVVALFSTGAIFDVIYYGSGGYIDDPSYNGQYNGGYYLAPNNTWIYNVTSVYDSGSGYYNYTYGGWEYPTANLSSVVRDCSPEFTSCAQQDAFVNQLWRQKPTVEGTSIVVAAVEWLGVLFHFILFVWACVDTHRRNSKKRVKAESLVADKIIQDLEKRGLIQTRNGVIVAAGSAPYNSAPNAPATEPLLAPQLPLPHESDESMTPPRL